MWRKKKTEDNREANWQVDAEEEEEEVFVPQLSEDSSEIEEIFKTQEAQDKGQQGEENGEE